MPENPEFFRRVNKEAETGPEELKTLLLKLTFFPNRGLPATVNSINLGTPLATGDSFSDIFQKLVDASLKDQGGYEYYRVLKARYDNKLLLGNMCRGNKYSATPSVALPFDNYGRQKEYLVGIAHSHRYEMFPISPQDCAGLMLGDQNYERETAVVVSTLYQNFLMFRTDQSPTYTVDRRNRYIEDWMKEVDLNAAASRLEMQDVARMFKMNRIESLSNLVNYRIQLEILWRKAQANHWALFVGDLESKHVKRATSFGDLLV